MTYAIIETGGKQLRVEAGRFYDIELLSSEPDEQVTIEAVLLVQHNGEVTIGQPLVAGATVEGTVMRHFRGRKVLVYKMKPKKKTRKKRGHRQEITRLMINSISLNGSLLVSEQAATAETDEASVAILEPVALDETPEVAETSVADNPPAETDEASVAILEPVALDETPEVAETPVADNPSDETAAE